VLTIVADNIRALMRAGRNGLRTQAAIANAAKRAGHELNQTSISRILNLAVAPQTDTLDALAAAFDIEPYQLLVPGLDPRNPQVLRVLSAAEARLYKALEEAREAGSARDP
jgi:transcriptional regulator with XRE-family HTH domain